MIKSQFNCCPCVWMFCSRQSNNLINQIRKRSQKTSYQNLLKAHNRPTIHQRILQESINNGNL